MSDIYQPRHYAQLGRGVPVPGGTRGSRDCGPATIRMGLDAVTRGELVPSVVEIRRRMGKQGPVTTNTTDADRCVTSYDAEMARLDRRRLVYDRFTGAAFLPLLTDAVRAGEPVQLAIDYGVFNRQMRARGLTTGDPSFAGGHSVLVHGWQRRNMQRWYLFDPLDDGRRNGIPNGPRWVPKAALLESWKALGCFFGVIRGGERTL